MAGSISLSLSQQFNELGSPLSGGKLYFIQAGTTSTPQNAYYDTDLTLPLPNPVTLDAAGRVPAFYLADGQIKIRLTSATGVTQIEQDNILVIGPSSGGGGGGGGGVDPTTVFQTGHIELFYGTGSLTGFVRCNGRTIGSASSGASERANADTQALFTFLWNADTNLVVSGGGRGASPASDFAASKTIATPDFRGRAIAGLDGMGSSTAGRLTSSYFGATATTLGATGGAESRTLLTANLPPYTPAGTITNGAIAGNVLNPSQSGSSAFANGSFGSPVVSQATSTFIGIAQGGTSTPVATVQPTILVTIYLKL